MQIESSFLVKLKYYPTIEVGMIEVGLRNNSQQLLVKQGKPQNLLPEKATINPADVINLITKGEAQVSTLGNKEVILVIGNTGSGKSTFINYMAESEQIKGKHDGKPIIITKNPLAKEGHGKSSETRYPYIYPIGQPPLNFCDCPGFGDNRGNEIEIANAASISKMAKTCAKVKCLILCMEYASVLNQKGKVLDETIENVIKFLGNPNLINSVFLLFTKAQLDPDITPTEMLKGLAKETPQVSDFLSRGNIGFYFPLDDVKGDPYVYNRGSLRRKISQFQGINYPKNYFKILLNPKAHEHIESCFRWAQVEIFSLISRQDHDISKIIKLMDSMYTLKELVDADSFSHTFDTFKVVLVANIAKLRSKDNAVDYLKALGYTLPKSYPFLEKTIVETLKELEDRLERERKDKLEQIKAEQREQMIRLAKIGLIVVGGAAVLIRSKL